MSGTETSLAPTFQIGPAVGTAEMSNPLDRTFAVPSIAALPKVRGQQRAFDQFEASPGADRVSMCGSAVHNLPAGYAVTVAGSLNHMWTARGEYNETLGAFLIAAKSGEPDNVKFFFGHDLSGLSEIPVLGKVVAGAETLVATSVGNFHVTSEGTVSVSISGKPFDMEKWGKPPGGSQRELKESRTVELAIAPHAVNVDDSAPVKTGAVGVHAGKVYGLTADQDIIGVGKIGDDKWYVVTGKVTGSEPKPDDLSCFIGASDDLKKVGISSVRAFHASGISMSLDTDVVGNGTGATLFLPYSYCDTVNSNYVSVTGSKVLGEWNSTDLTFLYQKA
jgi:hypothetical protein